MFALPQHLCSSFDTFIQNQIHGLCSFSYQGPVTFIIQEWSHKLLSKTLLKHSSPTMPVFDFLCLFLFCHVWLLLCYTHKYVHYVLHLFFIICYCTGLLCVTVGLYAIV